MNDEATASVAPAPKPEGLQRLREPVPDHLISPLPKGTKAQNECPADQKVNCRVCGGWHHPKIVHLSYVGHAAATHLLLDADPMWNWAPAGYDADGLPKFDSTGGLWIKLTVCGVTRLGYGHAPKKEHMDIGSREKEVIGDAIRNAAMRFGLALDLWSKADLHADLDHDDDGGGGPPPPPPAAPKPPPPPIPFFTIEAFKANLPKWQEVILAGRKSADELIAFVESKGINFNDHQKAELRKAQPQGEKKK